MDGCGLGRAPQSPQGVFRTAKVAGCLTHLPVFLTFCCRLSPSPLLERLYPEPQELAAALGVNICPRRPSQAGVSRAGLRDTVCVCSMWV